MNLKLKRTPGIFLIGFMGSGKSTVGRMLAEEIGWRFADLDDDIEHASDNRSSDIFQHRGEEEFRQDRARGHPQQRVRSIRRGNADRVLALGGGAFTMRGKYRAASGERDHCLDRYRFRHHAEACPEFRSSPAGSQSGTFRAPVSRAPRSSMRRRSFTCPFMSMTPAWRLRMC